MSDYAIAAPEDGSSFIHGSPVPVLIPDSNKKRAVESDDVSVAHFRFMDLPDELRLKIYQFVLPSGLRIFLDPENIMTPSPHAHEVEFYYDDVVTTLLISKKICTEATEFIYTHNMINIVKPMEKGNFLAELGGLACKYITKLECHVSEGLVDLGEIWATMMECPKLEKLRLVFYHEKINWSKTMAQLAYYEATHQEADLNIKLELHTSVHPRHPKSAETYKTDFARHIDHAIRHDQLYHFQIPESLRQIIITASVTAEAAYGFATFGPCIDFEGGFIGGSATDTDGMKTLTWTSRDKMPC